jgi:tripartite ATP-independent transporter DctM subunit
VGRIHGGLAQVNICASLIFSGMSGAALADVGGLGQMEINAMKKRGFYPPFSAAVTAASATVGPIFPPSIPLIIYGAVAGVSIVKLLLVGIFPAIVVVLLMMLLTALISVKRNYPRADHWPNFNEIYIDFKGAAPALFAPVLLVAGMLSGVFTPTETASVTAAYILFIGRFVYHELTWKFFLRSAIETVQMSARILLIVAVAALFGWILTVELIPQMFASTIFKISDNIFLLLLIVNIIYLIAGMFLDSTTAILLLVPIIAPPIVAAGVDPVHLGLITVFNLMIGLLTPPFGLSLFLVSDIAKVSIHDVLRNLIPYMYLLFLFLLFITYFPEASLWIPDLINK